MGGAFNLITLQVHLHNWGKDGRLRKVSLLVRQELTLLAGRSRAFSGAARNCVSGSPVMAGIGLPLYFGANKTALNCLTNICMSLFMLSNTALSNRAPPPRRYFQLFAHATQKLLKQNNY